MRCARFRMRTLILAVAVLSVAMGLGLRSARLREQARYHHSRELHYSLAGFLVGRCAYGDGFEDLVTIEMKPGGAEIRPVSPEAEQILKAHARRTVARKSAFENLASYHARCADQLEYAKLRPWLSVCLEPPPPDPE